MNLYTGMAKRALPQNLRIYYTNIDTALSLPAWHRRLETENVLCMKRVYFTEKAFVNFHHHVTPSDFTVQ
jgi:hypothetical protein